MRPQAGREVTINVTGKLPDGTSVSDKKVFRIKDIPAPHWYGYAVSTVRKDRNLTLKW